MRISESTLRLLAETDPIAYVALHNEYKPLLPQTDCFFHVRIWLTPSTIQTCLILRESP